MDENYNSVIFFFFLQHEPKKGRPIDTVYPCINKSLMLPPEPHISPGNHYIT